MSCEYSVAAVSMLFANDALDTGVLFLVESDEISLRTLFMETWRMGIMRVEGIKFVVVEVVVWVSKAVVVSGCKLVSICATVIFIEDVLYLF